MSPTLHRLVGILPNGAIMSNWLRQREQKSNNVKLNLKTCLPCQINNNNINSIKYPLGKLFILNCLMRRPLRLVWINLYSWVLKRVTKRSKGGKAKRVSKHQHNKSAFGTHQLCQGSFSAVKFFVKKLQLNMRGGRNSSVVSSPPTILRPRVRIPSTPLTLFQFVLLKL